MRAGSQARMRRSQRGQAVVEASLGILVFVTVLIFGIHFAEVGYLSVKVTEAANHATWDATARQHHNWSGGQLDSDLRAGSVGDAQTAAQGRYSDWDGRESADGAPPVHVFTEAENVTVRCEAFDDTLGAIDPGGGLDGMIAGNDHGGMSCSAQGQLNVINIGTFMEAGDGFFRVPHLALNTLPICSTGRASGGGCQGVVPIALGDWSFSDVANDEAQECDLFDGAGCQNPQYYQAVNRAFDNVVGPTGAGMSLAFNVAGFGTDEGAFWFTFKGSDSNDGPFLQELDSVHGGPDRFTVTPGGAYTMVPEYQNAYGDRQPGFLGFPPSYKYSSRN